MALWIVPSAPIATSPLLRYLRDILFSLFYYFFIIILVNISTRHRCVSVGSSLDMFSVSVVRSAVDIERPIVESDDVNAYPVVVSEDS